jgi:hypothetical protein
VRSWYFVLVGLIEAEEIGALVYLDDKKECSVAVYTSREPNVSANSVTLSPGVGVGGTRPTSNEARRLDEGRHPAWSRSAVASTKMFR